MKIVFAPHENDVCAFLASRDEINRARNSLFHVQLNALCTPSVQQRLSRLPQHMCRLNEESHEKIGTHLLQMRPRRVHSSSIASECNCEQDINAQFTRKMCDYFSSKRARNSTHAENHFCDCLVHCPIMHIKQPVVQVCDTNCCACEANVRMAAMLAEFVLCNHLQGSGKDKKNMLYHHQNSNCNGCHFMLHALKMTVFPLDGIMIRLKSTDVLKETSLR